MNFAKIVMVVGLLWMASEIVLDTVAQPSFLA